jgi:hypothetical protein
MIDYGGLKRHITLALGGKPSIVSGVTQEERLAEIINQAGQYLFSKQWRFRERTSRPISLVANQEWASLPNDADEIVTLVAKAGLGWRVELTTPQQIELFRSSMAPALNDSVYYAALTRPWAQTGTTTPIVAGAAVLPAARLDLYPTPQATSTDSIIVRYRAGWLEVSGTTGAITNDKYIFPVPPYIDSLLIAYCRAFAISYEDEGLAARLLEIDNGPIYNAAAIKDGIQQGDYGRLPAVRAGSYVSDPVRYRRGFLSGPA